MIFQIIAILLSGWSVVRGFRKGFQYQIPALVGICFGIVCARIFMYPVEDQLMLLFPGAQKKPEGVYFYDTLASGFIFTITYLVFSAVTMVVRRAFRGADGMLNSLCGAAFMLFRTVLFLSIFFNTWLALTVSGDMLRCIRSGDGNIVGSILLVAPPLLGGETAPELALTLQLNDARSIS